MIFRLSNILSVYKNRIYLALLLLIFLLALGGCQKKENLPTNLDSGEYVKKAQIKDNEFEFLSVPTQMTKLLDTYYIVDCYHSQILFSDDSTLPVKEWKVMCDEINMGHTICSDGVVYLCDDTENNRVLAYAKLEDEYYLLNEFDNIGIRPHYIQYNEDNDTFYVLSSLTGEFYLFKREKNTYTVYLDRVIQIPQLDQVYVRSFSFIDGLIYLPAGNGFIFEIDPESFEILSFQSLPKELGGPTQLCKIGDYYYLTVSTNSDINPDFANLVRAKSPDDFINGDYESLKSNFCEDGTPYVITPIEDYYTLAWHSEDGKNCMWKFETDKSGGIVQIDRVFR